MAEIFDLVLKNGTAVTPGGIVETDIAVKNGRIAAFGSFSKAAEIIDCKNLHVLPGVIDTQVHFREPGLTHKEDLSTGTLSAIAGGVTTVFEMPNTDPLTVSADAFQDKMVRAEKKAWCDYAFFIGGCAENAADVGALEMMPGCCGMKIFMGSSTGALLAAQDDVILSLLKNGTRRVALHAEDEERLKARKHIAETSHKVHDHPHWRDEETALKAVQRAVRLAREAGRKIHILHVTSAGEMEFLAQHKDIATVEITPQHLTLFSPDCYDRLGTLAQMNPPIRGESHRQALWRAVRNGVADVIGSDHAPHTLEEKAKPYPASPSGMTGVQTMLPVMLDHVHKNNLSLERLVDLLAHGPQRIYQIAGKGRLAAGYDADFAIVDLKKTRVIANKWIQSKCGWTPFDGLTVTGWVQGTILRGRPVIWNDEILGSPSGAPARFQELFRPADATGHRHGLADLRVECC